MRLSLFCFNAVYTTTTRTTSLFVRIAPPPWSTIPLRPLHFFFPRQRDFFIPARYPRGLDSLTLRGQKKEEGGGEKKGAERDRGRERRKNLPRPFVVGAEVLFAVETTSKTVQG